MTGTIEITGTGGIIEGNLGAANVNVNLDQCNSFSETGYKMNSTSYFTSSFDDVTIMFWATRDDLTDTTSDRLFTANGGNDLRIYLQNDVLRFRHTFADDTVSEACQFNLTNEVNNNDWFHIAAVYDGSGGIDKLFLNGVQKASVSVSKNLKALSSATDAWSIARRVSTTAESYAGKIADCKIYSTALSEAEIKIAASKINKDPTLISSTAPVGYWPIVGTTIDVTDNSSNSNNMTALGTPTVTYDKFSVDVYDNSTTTDGTFTVTQGKVEGKALTSLTFDGSGDIINVGDSNAIITGTDVTYACWVKVDNGYANTVYLIANQKGAGSTNMSLAVNRDASGNSAGKIDGFVWNGSSHIHTVYDAGINDGKWHHIVFTTTGSSQVLYFDGVQVATGSGAFSNSASTDDMSIGAFNAASPSDSLDGNMRDVRIYDYALSAERAASLYSNTYPQTPDHWWKIDEGSGSAVEDYGTGTDADGTITGATYTNGTLDLDGTLTIAANGTLSAPRGNLDVGGNMASNGALTHNNGKVRFTEHLQVTGTSLTFYNMSWDGSNIKTIDLMNDTTVENQLDGNNQWRLKASSNTVTLTMGTATSQGTIDTTTMSSYGLEWDSNTSNFVKIRGVNSLFPAIITGTNIDWDDVSSGLVRLENCDFQGDITTGGGGVTITLTGDCEFDAFTVSSGDTLDLNGQRMTTSGRLSGSGTFTGTNGLLSVADLRCDGFSSFDLQNTDIMFNASCTARMNGSPSNKARTMFVQSGDVVAMARATTTVNNLIAAGDLRQGNNDLDMALVDLTIPVGGNVDTQTRTGISYTCSGDFTTSGGLIGKSGLDFDGSTATATPFTFLDVPYDLSNLQNSDATIEMWINPESKSGDAKPAGIINGYAAGSTNRWQFDHLTNDTFNFNSHEYNQAINFTPNIGKMNHIALVFDDSENLLQIYHDGKLVGQNTLGTGIDLGAAGADPDLGISWQSTAKDTIRAGYMGFKGQFYMYRIFNTARTPAQLRADMFNTHGNMASTTGLQVMYQFDEGTGGAGDTVDNKEGTASRDGVLSNSGAAPNWVGGGTFTQGTSTVDLTGTGTLTFQGDIDFNILKCAAATKTTTIKRLSSGYININTNLYKGAGTLTRDGSLSWRWSWKTGTGAVNNSGLSVSGASYPVDLSNTYVVYYHDATIAKEVKWNYFINGSDTTLAADQETTGYWNTAFYKTDIGDYELKCHHLKMEGPSSASSSQVNIDAGNLEFTSTNGLLQSYPDNVFTAGPGATISGSSAGTTFKSQNNFVVVGKVENLNVTNEELSVTGQVINCTGEIHQQFPTIDHDQQLDFDTADDRDIILGRDLDKNTELINS
jgi:hypothetical protein